MSKEENKLLKIIKMEYTLGNIDAITNPPSLNELANKYNISTEELEIRSAEENWDDVKKINRKKLILSLSTDINQGPGHKKNTTGENILGSAEACQKRGYEKLTQLRDEELTFDMALKLTQIKHNINNDSESSDKTRAHSGDISEDLSVKDYIAHQKEMMRLAEELKKLLHKSKP